MIAEFDSEFEFKTRNSPVMFMIYATITYGEEWDSNFELFLPAKKKI
jgi:hypothetical protein